MRRVLLISALFAIGCASSHQALRDAERHQRKADEAAARRDYHKAAKEQDRATRDRENAYYRAQMGL